MGTQGKVMTWVGWVITGLVGLMVAFGGAMALMRPPAVAEQFVGKFGYPDDLILAARDRRDRLRSPLRNPTDGDSRRDLVDGIYGRCRRNACARAR